MAEVKQKRLSMFADSTPNSVKTLRAFYRGRINLAPPEEFMTAVVRESDRAAVVLMSSLLDDFLCIAISTKMESEHSLEELEHIFRFEGPLGTFSARVEIACLFGVIDDGLYQQLTMLREMRNACSHSKRPLSFKDNALANVALRLFEPLGMVPIEYARKNLKNAFAIEGMFLAKVICGASKEDAHKEFREKFKNIFED
jgi:hypothetical protein